MSNEKIILMALVAIPAALCVIDVALVFASGRAAMRSDRMKEWADDMEGAPLLIGLYMSRKYR